MVGRWPIQAAPRPLPELPVLRRCQHRSRLPLARLAPWSRWVLLRAPVPAPLKTEPPRALLVLLADVVLPRPQCRRGSDDSSSDRSRHL